MGKKIKLVLSGSGTLYPIHAGGILRLAESGYEIIEVCGTSGGAIIASALGTGYKPNTELVKLIKATLPHKHNAAKFSLWSLLFRWGLIKGDKIQHLLNEHLALKLGDTKIPTHIVVANLSTRQHRILNSKEDPEFSLAKAVRTSLSIPGVFEPIKIDDQFYVDGGVAANFPLDIFGTGVGVVGFRTRTLKDQSSREIKNAKDYTAAVFETMIEATSREHIEDAMFAKTIFLDSKHNSLNFNITDSDVDEMIQEGYDSVDRWLKTHTLEGLA